MILDLSTYQPVHVGVMGDVHCNTRWTISAVEQISQRLRQLNEPLPRFILQAGDFGVWNDRPGRNFLQQVNLVLAAKGAVLAFCEGNHEDFNFLASWEDDSPPGCPNIHHLPRGRRWRWHDRTWLALGGAVSPDKSVRTPQIDWFPQETITYKQAADVCEDGPANIMLTHDCPAGVPLRFREPPPPAFAPEDLRRSQQHRELMRSVVEEIEPEYLIHGHYHQGSAVWRKVIMPHGEMKISSLNMDGEAGNWGILNTQTMQWQ